MRRDNTPPRTSVTSLFAPSLDCCHTPVHQRRDAPLSPRGTPPRRYHCEIRRRNDQPVHGNCNSCRLRYTNEPERNRADPFLVPGQKQCISYQVPHHSLSQSPEFSCVCVASLHTKPKHCSFCQTAGVNWLTLLTLVSKLSGLLYRKPV